MVVTRAVLTTYLQSHSEQHLKYTQAREHCPAQLRYFTNPGLRSLDAATGARRESCPHSQYGLAQPHLHVHLCHDVPGVCCPQHRRILLQSFVSMGKAYCFSAVF